MNSTQRKYWYPKIVEKQSGEFCNGCGIQPIEWMVIPPSVMNLISRKLFMTKLLIVEHIDNNPSHNQLDNYQLLCMACNRIKNPSKPSFSTNREKTPEMERRDRNEPKFRNYVMKRINADRFTEYKDLVASACEFSGLAFRTGKDITELLVSTEGFYKKFEYDGEEYVCYKDEYQKIIEEIEEKENPQFKKEI